MRKRKNQGAGRDPGGFVALPWMVLDSAAYAGLSHPARSLLMELARQFVRDNNGRLLCSRAYLGARGWKSSDTLTRAKAELLDAGLIYETVKGARPNKAGWYALTWHTLDRHPGYDAGAVEGFRRGAYRDGQPLKGAKNGHKPSQIGVSGRASARACKNASLRPSHGTGGPAIAPSHGTEKAPPVPSHGAIEGVFAPRSVPSHGHHLEKPSAVGFADSFMEGAALAQLWQRVGVKAMAQAKRMARDVAGRAVAC